MTLFYRPFQFCKLLGYKNCDFNANQIPRLTIAHLQNAHSVPIRRGKETEINLVKFHSTLRESFSTARSGGTWQPMLIKLDEDEYHTFLILGTVSNGDTCSWICLYMRDAPEDASTFQVNFTLSNALSFELVIFALVKALVLFW